MNWDRGWSDQDVDADITAAKRKLRKFKERISIYLVYQTATLEKDTVNFHPDIYGHDVAARSGDRRAPLVAAVIGTTPKRTAPDQEGAKPPKNEQLAAR
jgi:murein L,D-transpeptidase YcbB/YkuD